MRGYQRGIWLPEMQAGRTVIGGGTGVPTSPQEGCGPASGLALRDGRFVASSGLRVRERDAPDAVVVPRHRVSPSASPMTGSSGASSTPRLSVQSRLPLEYWIRLRSLSYGGQVIRPTAYVSAISRRDAAEVCRTVVPPGMRGRREDRVRAAPAVSCANCTKKAHEHTGSAEAFRPSLRDGSTAYIGLSSVTGLSCHRRP
jgi:hypothetical protein